MLLISDLPNVLSDLFFGQELEWLFRADVGVLVAALLLCLVWKPIRPLWQYCFILLLSFAALWLVRWIGGTSWWGSLFSEPQASFVVQRLGRELRDLGVVLILLAALWILKRNRKELFLTRGDLRAPVAPVPWLGIRAGTSWTKLGWILAAILSLGTLVFMGIATAPTAEKLVRVIPLVPGILVVAGLNAFSEEISYRVSLLTALNTVVSKQHALLITSVLFGFAHYLHGSPGGFIGFCMTGLAGWFWGKSILETRGIFWAWFIHFLQDGIIYVLIAARSV